MKDEHLGRALAFAALPGALGALLVSGSLGFAVPRAFALGVCVMGAPLAGLVAGKDTADKVFSGLAAAVGSAGIVSATSGYIESRGHMLGLELLVPILLGGLPGLALFFGFRALTPRPLARTLTALAASVASVALAAAC
jgi:hypothetical protein